MMATVVDVCCCLHSMVLCWRKGTCQETSSGTGRGPASICPEIVPVQENALAEESSGELWVPGCHAPVQTDTAPGFGFATGV